MVKKEALLVSEIMDQDELELKEQLKELRKRELERRKQKPTSRHAVNSEHAHKPNAIYLSNLPTRSSIENDLVSEFSRYGIIKKDQEGNLKCKIYRNNHGEMKGDALIVYARHESVSIAIDMMNGYEFYGNRIKVEEATFNNDKKRKHEETTTNKDDPESASQIKLRKTSASENSDGDDRSEVRSRTLVIANIIDLYDDLNDDELADIRLDILNGCKAIGPVENMELSARKGEATLVFEKESDARECCRSMHKRYFDGRELAAFMLDEENISQSSDNYEQLLEDDLIEV